MGLFLTSALGRSAEFLDGEIVNSWRSSSV